MKKCLLLGYTIMFCLLIGACTAYNQNTSITPETPSDTAQTEPDAPPVSSSTPEREDSSQSEEKTSPDSSTAGAGLDPKQIYSDYFSDNFQIIEYEGVHGNSWQLWGHRTDGEVRLTKQIYIHQIEGFDDPVLVLAEFTLDDDGVTLSSAEGILNAYLIKDNELRGDLDQAEFDAVFRTAPESEGGGWSGRFENEILESLAVNGEQLFFLDFSGDVRTDGSMDIVLNWLGES